MLDSIQPIDFPKLQPHMFASGSPYPYVFGCDGGSDESSPSTTTSSSSSAFRLDDSTTTGTTTKQEELSVKQPQLQFQSRSPSPSNKRKRRREVSPQNDTLTRTTTTTTTPQDAAVHIINRVAPAKERRRTQMRLAQRAYRQRKQNELSTTQKRLAELEDAIAEFGTAYHDLRAKLVGSGLLPLQPGLAHSLRESTGRFRTLAQMASVDTTDFAGCEQEELMDNGSASDSSLEVMAPKGRGGDMAVYATTPTTSCSSGSMLFYPASFTATTTTTTTTTPTPTSTAQTIHIGDTHDNNNGNNMASSLRTSAYISPPASFSYHESSFARRLQRKCVESAYRVVSSNGAAHPAKTARIFKLAFRIWSKKYIVDKFRQIVMGWELDDPSTPYFSVGGAGTHYPRTNTPSSSVWDQLVPLTTNGPWPTHMAHIQHQGKDISVQDIVKFLGMDDGDWFDAVDVEGYLRSVGVYLQAHTMYAEFFRGGVPVVLDVEQFLDRIMSKAVCLGRSPGFRKRDVEEEFLRSIE